MSAATLRGNWCWLNYTVSATLSEMKLKPNMITRGRIWNLSFGNILSEPIKFVAPVSLPGFACDLLVQLTNTKETFENESILATNHSMIAKQSLGYNPYFPSFTGVIEVEYPDHADNVSGSLNEIAQDTLYRQVAPFLSFLQRRRVFFSNLSLRPSSGLITFPIQLAAEHIDAVAFGEPAIPPSELQPVMQRYMVWSLNSSPDEKGEVLGVITRLSNLLNLPYSYERAEGYWRIVEAIGAGLPDTKDSEDLFRLVKTAIGMKKNSKTLMNAVRAISKVNFTDVNLIASSFNFRNEITHEFIDFNFIGSNQANSVMNFLHGVCEAWVATTIGLDRRLMKLPANSDIFGRVV